MTQTLEEREATLTEGIRQGVGIAGMYNEIAAYVVMSVGVLGFATGFLVAVVLFVVGALG